MINTQQLPLILIVDDSPFDVKILTEALSPLYRIKIAHNGMTALEMAQREQPDLVLLDVVMPGIDGFEVCRRLKKNTNTYHIAVIFVTADATAYDEEFGLNLGAVDYITKPFMTQVVKARIHNHIHIKQQATINRLKVYEQELEQKVVERTAELYEQHRKYHSIIQTTGEGFWRLDKEGRLLEVNSAYARFSGYSEAELVGMWVTDLEVQQTPEEMVGCLRNIIQQGVDTFETRHRRKDGSVWDVEVNVSCLGEDGEYFVCFFRDIIGRKQNEQRLKESENFHRAVFDATPDAIFLSNKQGIIIQANRQVECLLGYQADEIIGQPIDVLLPEHLRAGHQLQYAKFTDSPVVRPMSMGMNVPALRKDGSEVNVEISLSPIQTEQGLIIASALRDVTQRKQMEDALRASEERFRRMANASPAMIWVTDVKGKPVFVNRTWLDFTGIAFREAMTHEGWAKLIHPDDRESVLVTYYDNIHRDEPILSEYRLRHTNGSWRYILDKGVPLYDESGVFTGYIGSAIDITERQHIQQLLQDKEQMLSESQRIAHIGSWSLDLATGYLNWSDEMYQIYGVAQETFGHNSKAFLELIHPDDQALMKTWINDCMAGKEPEGLNFRIMLADGTVRFIHGSGGLQYDDTKKPLRMVGSAQDITERRHAEAELRIAAVAFESQESMIITDVDGVILRVNQAFTESTGYKAEDVLGQTPRLFKSGRHDDAFYAEMWKNIKHTGTWQGEIWDRRKNGEIYPKWLTITAVKDTAGLVTHYVGTHTDITERKATEDEIKLLAFYDPLTQLPNRRLLQERLKHAINMERRDGKQLGLLMLDLDRFKAVNDSLGHLAGDELLQQVAERITARLRDVDMVARLGGDEFIVLLEDIAQPEDAARVAKEIIDDLTKPFCLTQSNDVQIGASIGISLYPQHGDSLDVLMDHADAALYQAKDAGRGCFAYFSEELTLATKARLSLETRLSHALEQQELRVFFQPQVDIASGRIVGAEALVRWQDPVEGLIMPSRFIPIAEETGLIIEIGAWVLRETCRQGRQWLDAGMPPLTLAVNVSAHQFRRNDFCALVATVLSDTGFPPEQLELEITESGLMGKLVEDTATALLNRLRAQGIRLAIDDFGTGYSSLAYLKHFPLDVLKIDKSFIDDIPFHQDDMEIAATVVAMGHILGFKVLAEGVETAEQLAFLQLKGCDSYQGFIKSEAVPAEEFEVLLKHNSSLLVNGDKS